ncbi:MAG: hypothetical protein VB025_10930 [Sphaerochaeta sp.]|nr:hypothetical protein [Sphaerochaeta sp.]
MRPRKAANAWLIVMALLVLVAFVGCDLAGYDITDLETESRKGKPGDSVADSAPWIPPIYLGTQGDVVSVPEVDQYETLWDSSDSRYRLLEDLNGDGTVDAWEVVASGGTHALVGEKFIGYYARTFKLWAGQTNFAGDVSISNGLDGVTISIDTTEAADIAEYHIYTYSSATALPNKRPAPGQAPYVVEGLNADVVDVFFTFEELGGTVDTTYYFIIHAALVADGDGSTGGSLAGETAYAAGPDTPSFDGKGSWFYVVGYTSEPYFEPIIEPLENVEEPGDEGYFPELTQDISNIVLIFDTDAGDIDKHGRNDGYYTIHMEGFNGNDSRDLDDMIEDILVYLSNFDQIINAEEPVFLGAVIKSGANVITKYYAYGVGDNGDEPLPEGIGFTLDGTTNSNVNPTNAIDATVDYGLIR